MTAQQTVAEPRKIRIQPHRLGMGWHYLWEYDPPIEHHVVKPDGTPYYWRDTGETSEGCIMWLADCFATQHLKTTAREIYQHLGSACEGMAVVRAETAQTTVRKLCMRPATSKRIPCPGLMNNTGRT
jgi:hypothetical protein